MKLKVSNIVIEFLAKKRKKRLYCTLVWHSYFQRSLQSNYFKSYLEALGYLIEFNVRTNGLFSWLHCGDFSSLFDIDIKIEWFYVKKRVHIILSITLCKSILIKCSRDINYFKNHINIISMIFFLVFFKNCMPVWFPFCYLIYSLKVLIFSALQTRYLNSPPQSILRSPKPQFLRMREGMFEKPRIGATRML